MIKLEDLKAGKTIFTVRNGHGPHTVNHFTFKVKKVEYPTNTAYYVSTLTGNDNTNDYTYIGVLTHDNQFRMTKGSKLRADSISVKVFVWILQVLRGEKNLPQDYSIMPAGTCFKCGRLLTTPQSIESGYGPVCAGRT